MKSFRKYLSFLPFYILVCAITLLSALGGSKAVSVMAENFPLERQHCIVIDAGHGGIDGGATSCTGVQESKLNLQIALRLNDLMHLLGMDTVMIRTTDESIHTQGETIAAQKVSDLKNRVRIVNSTENAILVSIHQNLFADSKYSGAQVFYGTGQGSEVLARALQDAFIESVNLGSKRKIKKADGVYLMQHIDCTGVLVECGFLSNPEEEAKLRSGEYQKKLCCVIAATVSKFINT